MVTVAHGKGRKGPKGTKGKGKAPIQALEQIEEEVRDEEEGDVDSDASHVKTKAKESKPKAKYPLPIEREEALLVWLQGTPILWRRGHMDYRDAGKKRLLWEERAKKEGKSADYLKRWWKGIHDTYVRKLKKTSGQATPKLTDREQWVMERCAFYKQEARHRAAPLKNVSIS